jgi:site-specific DNA recombinase
MYIYTCFKTIIVVGVYCRISGKKEDDKDTSIETQIEEGIDFATNVIGENYKIYKDIGVSGKAEIEERNDFNQFIKDIQKGEIQHIFAINQSRIERSPKTWQIFVASVLNAGVKWYPEGNFYDLDNTTNRLMANMMSIINEFHSDNTSDAVKKAFKKNALKGKSHGINTYGITKDENGYMIHHPEEIKVVKDIFKWSLEGIGAYSIAKELNNKNIPTRYASLNSSKVTKDLYTKQKSFHKNKKWWGSTVHGILKKKLHRGIYTWGDEEVHLPHLEIISADDFEKTQKNLKKNKKQNVGKPPKYKYLLNGLLFCSECGHKFFGKRRKASRENTYKCSGKQAPLHVCTESRGFNISKFETFILQHLFVSKGLKEYLNSIEVDNDALELLEVEKSQLNRKIASTLKMVTKAFNMLFESDDEDLESDVRIIDKYKNDKIKLETLKESLEKIEQKIRLYKDNNRLIQVNQVIDGFDINSGFDSIKKAIHELIERIDVNYHKRDKGGTFYIKIKYKGYDEVTSFYVNQQLLNFSFDKSIMNHLADEDGYEMIEEQKLSKLLLRFRMKGLVKHELDIFINSNELVTFE